MATNPPKPGNRIIQSLINEKAIIMAANTRVVPGVVRGILRAAKDLKAPIIFELARSECNLERGYTGHTPESYAKAVMTIADEVGWPYWALHADHITLKKGDADDIASTKKLIKGQIDAGFTSFAIDASYLFDHSGKTTREELAKNIEVTTELAHYIADHYGSKDFGLECEVGEVGKKDTSGLVLTTADEASTYIKALKENGVEPDLLAIANGSSHGNIYDKNGNPIEQVTINIPRTVDIAQAIAPMNVKVAQHGITGTPLRLINTTFPKGHILKGNVGTFWMNIVWETFEIFEPELYQRIYNWTLDTYREDAAKKGKTRDVEIFGTYSKNAIKQFYDEIYSVGPETLKALEARAYFGAAMFFKAFDSVGMTDKIKL